MNRALAATLAAVLMAACNNGGSDSTLTTSPTITTDSFVGSVTVGGSDFKPFTVSQAGTVNVTLTAAGPPPTIFMGLGIGTPSAATCALLAGATTQAQAGTQAQLSGTLGAGSYCVEVYDIGNQVGTVTYALTVAHP